MLVGCLRSSSLSYSYFIPSRTRPSRLPFHDFRIYSILYCSNDRTDRNNEDLYYNPPGRLGLPLPCSECRSLARSQELRSHNLLPATPRHPQRHHQLLLQEQQFGQLVLDRSMHYAQNITNLQTGRSLVDCSERCVVQPGQDLGLDPWK
jgi:hypothetical protein